MTRVFKAATADPFRLTFSPVLDWFYMPRPGLKQVPYLTYTLLSSFMCSGIITIVIATALSKLNGKPPYLGNARLMMFSL